MNTSQNPPGVSYNNGQVKFLLKSLIFLDIFYQLNLSLDAFAPIALRMFVLIVVQLLLKEIV